MISSELLHAKLLDLPEMFLYASVFCVCRNSKSKLAVLVLFTETLLTSSSGQLPSHHTCQKCSSICSNDVLLEIGAF
jgi:hypothetical protein